MRTRPMTFPELALIAGTRGLGGIGLGLLLSGQLSARQRRRLGWPLMLIGIGSTVPILMHVMRKPTMSGPTSPAAPEQERTPATART
jgi:hypothetical protein